jgi:hypothetical protein
LHRAEGRVQQQRHLGLIHEVVGQGELQMALPLGLHQAQTAGGALAAGVDAGHRADVHAAQLGEAEGQAVGTLGAERQLGGEGQAQHQIAVAAGAFGEEVGELDTGLFDLQLLHHGR